MSNNSFNPTALSAPFINTFAYDAGCVVSSDGGLIQALYGLTFSLNHEINPLSCARTRDSVND